MDVTEGQPRGWRTAARPGARHRLTLAVALVAVAGLTLAGPSSAAPKYPLEGGKGHVTHHPYGKAANGITYDYLVYTPVGWKKSERLPVYVVLHGCATSASVMAGATWMNALADVERFLVVYPDNGGGCWRAVSDDIVITATDQTDITRGLGGEADIVANITKRTITGYHGDATRVYLAGGSAGAFQTASTAMAYPELYAAVGIVAGGGPGMAVTCAGYPAAVVPAYAQRAVERMGRRAHMLPFFVIGGTLDPLGMAGGVAGCSQRAYEELLYINNLLRPNAKAPVPGACGLLPEEATPPPHSAGVCVDSYMTNPYATQRGQVPGGHTYTRRSAQDTSTLCEIGQEWVVDDMGHTWPGPSGNRVVQGDPKAPSATKLSWQFFKRFRLEHGQVVCHPGAV